MSGLNRQYILLPNCLYGGIVSCKTSEQTIENTSDHLPVQLKINYYDISFTALSFDNCSEIAAKNDQFRWSNFCTETISTRGRRGLTRHLHSEAPAGNRKLAMTFG